MAGQKSRTSIYTLSKEVGVSPATVSKALNNAPGVSAEVRERIRALARKYNFRPRVVPSRSPNICALIQQYPEHRLNLYSYLSFVIEGIADYCREESLEMSLFLADIEELNRFDIIQELGRRNVDGAIILRSSRESRFVHSLDAAHFPYCSILTGSPARPGRLLTIDNREVACRAVTHLLELGHRKIAALATPSNVQTGQLRLQGYRQTLEKAGIEVDEELICRSDSDLQGLEFGYQAVRQLLKERPDTTALFAFGHQIALGALHACQTMGVSIPQDLSLLTCDDFPGTAYLHPPLTAIRIPNQQLGYMAARQVHRLIRNLPELEVEQHTDLGGELIVRESTAPPRRGKAIPWKVRD